jgi:hypothetical protein
MGAGTIEITGKLENNRPGIMLHHVVKEVVQGRVIIPREIKCHRVEDLQPLWERA